MMNRRITYIAWLLLLPLLWTAGCKKKTAPPPARQEKVSAPLEEEAATPAPATSPVTRYYLITGSFLYPENEQRYEEMMRDEGFTPMQLPGDSGFHRVSVFSFDEETEAREKLRELRSSSPQYRDAWLLIRTE